MSWPDDFSGIRETAQLAAARLRLPFRSHTWRGAGGNWQGAGIGNSIDFQDHRPYLPGDDPRYIDWQAYARTGHYAMKLYREEVSPRVDVVFDLTESMTFDAAKRRRAFEIFQFCIESALRAGTSLACHALDTDRCVPWPVESALLGAEPPFRDDAARGAGLEAVPWRPGSLRVWVTDLLFPGSPEGALAAMSATRGRGVLLVLHGAAEADPDWDGNIEFTDCESRERRAQHVSAEVRRRYLDAYARHFELWEDHARRHGILMARVAAEPDFLEALQGDPARTGAVEWCD